MAQKLGVQLSGDRKIMLGVQLYDLISQAGLKQEQVVAFYSFMSQMGMAAQAIDIVYQLNASEDSDPSIYQHGASPLESLSFGPDGKADVTLKNLNEADSLMAFRYHELILLKNYSDQNVSVRGRPLVRGGFCRIYPGQRILVGDQVLSYQELAQYFNAKKNVSLPQIFIRVNRDSDEVGLERSRTRESALRVTFGLKVRTTAPLKDGDTIRIDIGQFLRCNFSERIIEEERNIIRTLEANEITHRFGKGQIGLEGISFNIARGELVCVMGASGSGKSTLMRVLAGQLQPTSGEVVLNGQSLYENLDALKHYVSYMPQQDAFDEHLTIGENLLFAAAIRAPHLSRRDRTRRLEAKLVELGLGERRDAVVGSPEKKTLSGGERKRLNIGLDMIGMSDVYLFDEPTSGLSSKDSEHVIEIIRSMAHNKIIIVTIHQPSSKLFQLFHKAILLDKGGRLVFFGTPTEMLRYFAEAEHQHQFGADLGACPSCGTTRPEFIFDVLETPLRDLSGDIIYEENSKGQLVAARRYSPEFWRDKYEAFRLIQDVKQVSLLQEPVAPLPAAPIERKRLPVRWHDEWTQFRTLLRRSFLSKLRNRANMVITIGVSPVLALLIATILRYSENGTYDFASAYHIPTFLFPGLIVAMFLGLTNSADDIIRDRPVLQRERNIKVRLSYYVVSKTLTLGVFAFIQCVLFVLIGNSLLQIRGMFWLDLGF